MSRVRGSIALFASDVARLLLDEISPRGGKDKKESAGNPAFAGHSIENRRASVKPKRCCHRMRDAGGGVS
jgi:hypothetical protein